MKNLKPKDYWRTHNNTLLDTLELSGCTHFVLDACAQNYGVAKSSRFISEQEDALTLDWNDKLWDLTEQETTVMSPLIWCNPPFSLKEKLLKRCAEMAKSTGIPVAALVPCPITTDWWFETVVDEPEARVWIPNGRICFINPVTNLVERSPLEATCIVLFGETPLRSEQKYNHYKRRREVDSGATA